MRVATRRLRSTLATFRPSFAPEVVGARFARAWAEGTMQPHFLVTIREIGLGFLVGAGSAVLALSRLRHRQVPDPG